MVTIKRVYDPVSKDDGQRILVDRLWPRGLSKERARIDDWLKDVAPSTDLREWFGHDPKKWPEFKKRYLLELKTHTAELKSLANKSKHHKITLVYAAKDEQHNNAVVLKQYLERL